MVKIQIKRRKSIKMRRRNIKMKESKILINNKKKQSKITKRMNKKSLKTSQRKERILSLSNKKLGTISFMNMSLILMKRRRRTQRARRIQFSILGMLVLMSSCRSLKKNVKC